MKAIVMDPLRTSDIRVAGNPSGSTEGVGVDQMTWRRWMQAFGQQARRTRDFLRLSQEQVARLAGVSQGAVSRLEAAQGLATPFLVVFKVQQVLAQHLRRLDPALLNAELRRAIDLCESLAAPFGHDLRASHDPQLADLMRLFHDTPIEHREALLGIVRAAVGGFKTPAA